MRSPLRAPRARALRAPVDGVHSYSRARAFPRRRPRESRSRADSRDKDQDSELGIYVADEDDESRYEGKSNDFDDGRESYGTRHESKSDLDYDAKGD